MSTEPGFAICSMRDAKCTVCPIPVISMRRSLLMSRTTISPELRPTRIVTGIPCNGLLHPERRVASSHRMILMRERCAKERHDSVAHQLIDRALIAVDCLDHAVNHRLEEFLRILGIKVGKQFHRAIDVSEQHGDLLALTLECYPRGQNLVGEVLGGIVLGRGEASIVRRRLQGMATFRAELGCGRHPASAISTSSPQRSCTLLAELRLSSVFVVAFRTLHGTPWMRTRPRCASVTSSMIGNKKYVLIRCSGRGLGAKQCRRRSGAHH